MKSRIGWVDRSGQVRYTEGMKTWAILTLLLSWPAAWAVEKCDHDLESVMMYEQRILSQLKEGDAQMRKEARPAVMDALVCLIDVQQNSRDFTRYVANSFLQTFLGNGQVQGVPIDQRYKQVSDLLLKMAEYSKDPAHLLMLEAHSKGEWGLYALMCEKGSTAYCSDFLPDTKRITKQAPLVAASSMLLLKTAYFKLNGSQQRKVFERIRELYRSIDKEDTLKRRMIDSIYNEVLPSAPPLGMLG